MTPTYFSRNGRTVPLPDPVLVLRSLTQRWNTFAPAGLAIDDTLGKALLATALLTDADLHTVRVQVGRDAWQTGFVGDTETRPHPHRIPRRDHALDWSCFRREHQTQAGRHHFRRRLKIQASAL
ncbi:MAG: CRISPR system precrRNA processing endoribonuclease RAMP protein Cas6 [Pseudonocardiaceae bacterium]